MIDQRKLCFLEILAKFRHSVDDEKIFFLDAQEYFSVSDLLI